MMVLSTISLKISLKSWILSLKVNQLQQLSLIVTIKLRGEPSGIHIKWIISKTFRYLCPSKMARIYLRLESKILARAFRTLSLSIQRVWFAYQKILYYTNFHRKVIDQCSTLSSLSLISMKVQRLKEKSCHLKTIFRNYSGELMLKPNLIGQLL